MTVTGGKDGGDRAWDHSSHPDFYEYYAKESQSDTTAQRFRGIQGAVLRIAASTGMAEHLDVADIGCGAGTQSRMWAEPGHRVRALDVNEPLIQLARRRAEAEGLKIAFEVGSATALPWDDASVDICLVPELLEHVDDWQSVVSEAARIVRPGGLLYLSTTNVLCPKQEEFDLPLYSWYPAPVKRYCERLAVTTRPQIANFAKYPAVHWFSFYGLRDFLKPLGFARCLDRFDLMDMTGKSAPVRTAIDLLRALPPLRFLGHVATSSTYLVAIKNGR